MECLLSFLRCAANYTCCYNVDDVTREPKDSDKKVWVYHTKEKVQNREKSDPDNTWMPSRLRFSAVYFKSCSFFMTSQTAFR